MIDAKAAGLAVNAILVRQHRHSQSTPTVAALLQSRSILL